MGYWFQGSASFYNQWQLLTRVYSDGVLPKELKTGDHLFLQKKNSCPSLVGTAKTRAPSIAKYSEVSISLPGEKIAFIFFLN